VPKTLSPLCNLGILADQAAETVLPQNPDIGAWSGWMWTPGGRALLQRPVGPMDVVMTDVFAQDQPQVPFTGDRHPVQALMAGAGDPALRDRVRTWRLDRVLMIRPPIAVNTARASRTHEAPPHKRDVVT
jgi:hypothetical protein